MQATPQPGDEPDLSQRTEGPHPTTCGASPAAMRLLARLVLPTSQQPAIGQATGGGIMQAPSAV